MRPSVKKMTGSGSSAVAAASILAMVWAFSPAPLAAQSTSASPAVLGTANNYSALVRGFGAVGLNPAGLGMPDGPVVSLALPAVGVNQGLGPITLRDVNEFAGREIPAAAREEWLQRIERQGGQTGSGRADISGLSLNVGGLGFQHTTIAVADVALDPTIAELVLFGNAGRTGTPADLLLTTSEINLSAFSSFDIAYGFELPVAISRAPNEAFAVGVTGRYTIGHFLAMGRDLGSEIVSDPLEMSIHFPVIEPDLDLERINLGDGVGIDVGAMWRTGRWSLGASLQNLFHSFSWDQEAFVVRPGTATFDAEGSESNFDPIPIQNAPQELRDEMASMTFGPSLVVGAGFRPSSRIALTADYRGRFGDGIALGPNTHLGAGLELRLLSFLPLRSGVAYISDDSGDAIQLAAGAGLRLGPLNLSGAGLFQSGDAGDGARAMLAFSLGGQ